MCLSDDGDDDDETGSAMCVRVCVTLHNEDDCVTQIAITRAGSLSSTFVVSADVDCALFCTQFLRI